MNQNQSNLFNPFPGLRPFNEEEDYLFFGREQQVAELVTLLRNQRFIAVTGSSGSGKSSLVRAGLIPELQGGMMKEVGSDWETLVLRPGGAPLKHLAEAIAEASMEDPEDPKVVGELLATLSHSGLGLVEAIRQSEIEPGSNVLILIDQFEEIFRFQRSGAANQEQAFSFVNLLLEAGAQRDVPIFVIITMRSDYLGDCTEFRGLAEAVNEGEYLIPRLNRDQIRSCIEGPIRVGGGDISFALVQELLNSIGTEQDQLPVLQHALMRTFDRWQEDPSGGEQLELDHYRSVGGMEEALSRHADEVFEELDATHQAVAKSVFKAITERGVDNRGIRRPTRLDLLTEIADADLEQVIKVVEAYRKPGVTFLMPPAEVPLTPDIVVDISHESLMRVWARLEEWVDDEAQSARIYRRLTETAELHQQNSAGLYRDPDLQIAISWRDTESPTSKWASRYAPGFDTALSFLQQSEEAALAVEREKEAARQRELEQAQALATAEAQRAESQQRAARRLKILSTVVASIAVIALIAFVFALSAQRESIRQRSLAEQSANEAQEAKIEAENNATEAIKSQSLAESARREAEAAAVELNDTLTRSQFVTAHEQLENGENDLALAYLARSLRTKPTYWQAAAQIMSLLSTKNFPVEDVKTLEQEKPFRFWGLDKSKRIAWTMDDELKGFIWDTKTATKIAPINGGVRSDWPEFTESGEQLFVSLPEQGGSIVGVDTKTGQPITPVIELSNRVNRPYQLLSKADGQVRVLLDDPQTRQLGLWDAITGESISLDRESPAPLVDRRFGASPDHRHVFAAYADQTINVWRASDGRPVVRELNHGLGISDCGMSPDSRWVFVSSQIQQTVAWADLSQVSDDPNSHPELKRKNFLFPIRSVAFHPTKPLLMIAGRTVEQGMLRVLNLETGEVVTEITEDDFGVQSKESMAGIRFLGYEDDDNILRRWIVGIASQKGRQLRVCDLESGGEIHRFDFDDSLVKVANFTPDGSRLITSHTDRTLRIWNVFSGQQVTSPIEHPFEPSFSISEDGQKVVTFNVSDMSLRVYSTRTGEQLLLPLQTTTGGFVSQTKQLGDRTQFITGERTELTAQGVAKLDSGLLTRWSARPRIARRLPQQFDGSVFRASFSPDGEQVVAGCVAVDTKVKIWAVADGKTVQTFRHGKAVMNSTFSPTGDRIVTGSADGVVRIWDLDSGGDLLHEILPGGEPVFVQFDPSGKKLLIKTFEGSFGVWDSESGFPVFDPIMLEGEVEFSVDGQLVIVGGADGILRVVDSESGKVTQLGDRHSAGIGIGLHPDGIHVSTSAFGDFLKIWSMETGELAWSAPTRESNLATTFHPEGDIVAVCNAKNSDWELGRIDLWNWRTGERPVEALQSEGQVYPGALQFSPDGRFIAAGTVNGIMLVWEVSTGKRLYRARQHSGRIWTLSFSQDSKRLLTSGGDGAVNIYELPPDDTSIPDWLPTLAELVAKKRVNEGGAIEDVTGEITELKASILASEATDPYTQWARWFLGEPLQRQADHSVELSTTDYVEIKSQSASLASQYEAFLIDPNNGLISCRIGYLLAVSPSRTELDSHSRKQWDETAIWYCDQGVESSPEVGEAWALKAAVEQILERPSQETIQKALELDPDAANAWYVNAYELQRQGNPEEAYQAFRKSIRLLPPNRHVLDWENRRPFLVGTLRQILAGKELNASVLAQVGISRLSQIGESRERRLLDADWLTRYACELGPEDATVWRYRAQMLTSADRAEEQQEAIAKSLQYSDDGTVDWHQYGRLLNHRADELVQEKQFFQAHAYVLRYGVPPRSPKATSQQIDLSAHYNQPLIQMPYRSAGEKNNSKFTWNRLPIGLSTIDDTLFDLRGFVRLSGEHVAGKPFVAPVSAKVSNIRVNQSADYIHFLHNIAARPARRVPHGEVVGYYTLRYADNEEIQFPIRYGKDVVPWVFSKHIKPTRASVGWSEGVYGDHKTLCHTVWCNPRPDVEIESISFESTNTHSAPFLMAISVETVEADSESIDTGSVKAEQLARDTLKRAIMAQGKTDAVINTLDAASKRAVQLDPENEVIAYQRAEVLFQLAKYEDCLVQIQTVRKDASDRIAYRLLEGRASWKLGRIEEAATLIQRQVNEKPLATALSEDQLFLWKQFCEDITEEMGEFAARDWLRPLMIPPQPSDSSMHLVDLTDHYNAHLEESWYTPRAYPNYSGAFLSELHAGVHVLEGVPYDIRGLIQLNDQEKIPMYYPYPKQVEGIQVGAKGDQIHFLNATLSNDRPGSPVIIYQIELENGETHQHVVRFGVDIHEMTRDHDTPSPDCAVWRQPNVTPFSSESDAIFHQSTWNNPTPEQAIKQVNLLIGGSQAQPFLAAMTLESFAQQLEREPGEIIQVATDAVRKLNQQYAWNDSVLRYVQAVVGKIQREGSQEQRALELLSRIHYSLEEYATALETIDKALAFGGSGRADCLQLKSEILGRLGEFSEALIARQQVRQAYLDAVIPDRNQDVDARCLDLTGHYNLTLEEFPYQTEQPSRTVTETFVKIEPGVQKFSGVPFDVRGLVALSGTETELAAGVYDLKTDVDGISVGRKASKIHLLHGAGWGDDEPHGTCIGQVEVLYVNGETELIEICAGVHVRDWFLTRDFRRDVTEGELAWVQPSTEVTGRDIGLYTMNWENPNPETEIQSINFRSTMTAGAPFLLGVTLED